MLQAGERASVLCLLRLSMSVVYCISDLSGLAGCLLGRGPVSVSLSLYIYICSQSRGAGGRGAHAGAASCREQPRGPALPAVRECDVCRARVYEVGLVIKCAVVACHKIILKVTYTPIFFTSSSSYM